MSINMTYEEIESQAGQLRSGQEQLTSILEDLRSQVQGLIESGFQTEAASGAFGTAYDDFTTGTTQAVEGIEGMAAFLDQTAQSFRETDEGLASGIGG
ncbi:WXG100 family type VII secretion target [Myceligenerans indicum]|uniref:ESAT-6-like protein n=1 Tax=Myceligenerans indicum TaxID=2593663 RepID=A0ABS1LH98_9MICO|nr:WXG100 family type VII secretion target [Myceligenerans indicum]MBL0885429.1 WXG100 family type VII secretion target [Myceligenerans indicum]